MKISIITCTWNSARYLPRSIESVLMQDYPDIEYIFVDGGSDDGTVELIRSIPRPVVFVTGERRGISAAMNRGIELATGDIIAHLHSDDYYLHGAVIRRIADVFLKTHARWCFGRALDDIDGDLKREPWVVPRYSYSRLLKGNFIPHPATFVAKSLFNELGGFDSRYRYAMDYDMWLRIGRRHEPAQLDEHLAAFRRHSGSISTANQMAGLRETFAIRVKHMKKTPWNYVYHGAHHVVRELRLRQKLVHTALFGRVS